HQDSPRTCAWRLTPWSVLDGLPELSNSYCPPGRAGGFPISLKPIADGAEALSKKLGEMQSSGILQAIGQGIAKLFTDAGQVVSDFVCKVNWSELKNEAGKAIAYVRTALDETISGVQGKIQTVSDWTTTVFSPLTQAVDGYRLAWATANKDQAEAARLQAQIEARTAAIGRALSGTSSEYGKAAQAAGEFGKKTSSAAQSTAELQSAAQAAVQKASALAEAVKAQQAEVDRLSEANARGKASNEEYGAAVQKLWALQGQLKNAQQEVSASTEKAVELQKIHSVELAKIEPAIQGAATAAQRYKENLAEVDRQIKAANNNIGDWREGLKLTAIQMVGLKDSAAAYAAKLALVEEAQRNGKATDKEVAAVKQQAIAAQDRYNKALDEYVTQQERAVDAAQRSTALDAKSYDLAIQRKQAEAELASAKGEMAAATKAEAEAIDLLIEKAESQVAHQQKEIEAYQANIEAVRLKLAADGELSAADQAQLATMTDKLKEMELERQSLQLTAEATRDKAKAEQDAAKGAVEGMDLFTDARRRNEQMTRRQTEADKERGEQLKMQGSWVSGILTGWQQRLGSFSDTARKAFDEVRAGAKSVTEGLSQIDIAIQKNEREMRVAQEGAFRGEGLVKWANQVAVQALTVERAFLTQAKAVETFSENIHAAGEGGLASARKLEILIEQAEASQSQLTLLDQSQLDHLQQEIDDAKQKLQALQDEADSARDSISELNAEIAREKGDTATADRLALDLERQQKL
ncbi:MAG: hypothetical protein WAU60_05190, partial [Candidatus Competibacter denitrificans]